MLGSDNLRLVSFEEDSDLTPYHQWLHNPEVTKYLESRFKPPTFNDLRNFVRKCHKDPNCYLFKIMFRDIDVSSRSLHIGNIKLDYIDWIHKRGEIGIMIGEKWCWGKGCATHSIMLLVEYAFRELNLERLTAGCYAQNEGSKRAFLKAGFQIEGTYRKHIWCDGEYHDEVLMGLLKEESIYAYHPDSLLVPLGTSVVYDSSISGGRYDTRDLILESPISDEENLS